MVRSLPLLSAAALVLGAGVLHGRWTNRWEPAPELETAAARLSGIPSSVGDWKGEDRELDQEQVAGARLAGYCCRRYENRRTHRAVTVLVVCGRPGPVSAHTPDVCYQGSGYSLVAAPAAFSMDYGGTAGEAGFKTVRVRKAADVGAEELRVFWSWSAGRGWSAPDNPRWRFARHSALYKLYALREKPAQEDRRVEDDPCVSLLKLLLPELDRALGSS